MHSSRMRTARSLTVSRRVLCTPPDNHACPLQPCTPQQPCMPLCNHACPPATMYAPLAVTHVPPMTTHAPCNHTHPPATMHTPQQLHTPNPPSPATMHAPLPATHAPQQPRMRPPPVDRMTHTCKNITLPQTSFAGGNKDTNFNFVLLVI